MKCFYHNADLDGRCSAAIVRKKYPKCEMVGINYGDKFPWDILEEGEQVIMVDFHLQPFDDMVRLSLKHHLTWIDHHISARLDYENPKYSKFVANVVVDINYAACELAWRYYFPQKAIPKGVKLLGRYDVFDLDVPQTLPFQYGMRMYNDIEPESFVWDLVFSGQRIFLEDTIKNGNLVLKYQEAENEKFIRGYGIETEFEGVPAIVINGRANSQMFEGVNEEDYPLWITFIRTKNKHWTVTLFSKTIDVSIIAKKYGGGGHVGAAGFQCSTLPFKV